MVEMVFNIMKTTLESGDKIKIAGFGNFVVKQKPTAVDVIPKQVSPLQLLLVEF